MKQSIWFWVLGSIATLFYLFGSVIFSIESFSSKAFLIQHFGSNADIILNRPWWVKIGYAMSVYLGVVACLFILLRNPHAQWLTVLSFVGMIVQQYYWWTGMNISPTMKGFDWIWPIIIPMFSMLLIFLSLYYKKD